MQEVQEWTGIKGDLFDSILVFENYPVSKLVASREWALQVAKVEIIEQTNYPLTISIGIGEELSISFSYNADLLEEAYIIAIRDQFEQVLLQIRQKCSRKLKDISLLTAAQEHNAEKHSTIQ